MSDYIPFNRPSIVGKELYYISEAIHNGYSAGDAAFTKKCHALLEESLGVPKVLLTTSCTHALEMAALLLDIEPGDEVIVPVVHLRHHSQRLCAARRQARLRRHPPGYAEPGRSAAGGTDHRAHQGHRSGALCRRRLRDGCHLDIAATLRHRRRRGQRPRSVRQVYAARTWAPLAPWPPRASTRPRTSSAARAVRC